MLNLINILCQIGFPLFWLSGSLLVTNYRKRIGLILKLISIPLAITSYVISGLWGSLFTEIIALLIISRGYKRSLTVDKDGWL